MRFLNPLQKSIILCAVWIVLSGFAASVLAQTNSAPKESAPESSKKTEDQVQPCPEQAELRKVTGEVQRLKRKVSELEKWTLASTLQEQLSREQQRGEQLQLRLIEISEKEEPLQARLDQIIQGLRPENIDRALAGYGSVRPEEAREELRRRLNSERIRVQAQLDLYRQDRARTQASLVTTDAAILRLKQKLLEATR